MDSTLWIVISPLQMERKLECQKMKHRMPRVDILLSEMPHLFAFIFPYWYHEKNENNNNNNNNNFRPCFTKAITQLFNFPYWCRGKWNNNNNSDHALQRLNTTQFGAYFKNTLLLWQLTDTYNNINRDKFSQKAGHMLLKEHGSTVGGRLLALLL
jgi:hypothetical protein